ncbi:MAG: enoyl-CoA hydratase [Kordia sp.]|nr:MAG: enoyl-CoA hydratase [Kordia sp.]
MRTFNSVTVDYFPEQELLIWKIKNTGMPNFCIKGLEEFKEFASWVKEYFSSPLRPLKFIVSGSHHKDIYNLGGDLPFFLNQIREEKTSQLRKYAYLCIDAIYTIYTSFSLPVITIALVEGNAYGGGFECALAHDYILAKETAKFCFPESKFNLFPGMGAYSFLLRVLNKKEASIILKGDSRFSAIEFKKIGLIHKTFKESEEPLNDFVNKLSRNYNFNYYDTRCKKEIALITKKELLKITDIWVEATKGLNNFDLRKMDAFGKAQSRKVVVSTS